MKINHTQKVLSLLKDLSKKYCYQSLMMHISIALSDYPSVDTLTDKEFLHALEKYSCEKELDMEVHIEKEDELEKIIKGGMNLDSLYEEDEF